jgi:hypothetical protein
MVTALVLLLGALDGGAAPVTLTPGRFTGERCVVQPLTPSDTRVRWAWKLQCGLDWVLQAELDARGAVAIGNYEFAPVLLADATRALAVEATSKAPFSPALVDTVRLEQVKLLPPGYEVVSKERGLLTERDGQLMRATQDPSAFQGWALTPVFTKTKVGWASPSGIAFDPDVSNKTPWVFAEKGHGATYSVELVAPGDTVRFSTSPRQDTELTTRALDLVMPPHQRRPAASLLSKTGEHFVITPSDDASGFRVQRFFEPPLTTPTGRETTPQGPPWRCSDERLTHTGEVRQDPAFFTLGDRLFLAWGATRTTTRFHQGLIPIGAAEPQGDSQVCGWVEDMRDARDLLVVNELAADGTLTERLTIELERPVAQLTARHRGDQLVLLVRAADLIVLSIDPKSLGVSLAPEPAPRPPEPPPERALERRPTKKKEK